MYNNLYFRRQFLLSREPIAELAEWQCFPIAQYYLYAHPDLEITIVKDGKKTFALLGYLFDPEIYESENKDILQRLIESTDSFSNLLQALKPYPGRYALLYLDDTNFYIIQDALSLREVYYCQTKNTVVCGSQPNLLVRFARPVITETADSEILDFMQNHLPYMRNGRLWVGDETCYSGVKHLMTNHYLDITTLTVKRYWPDRKLEHLEFDVAVKLATKYLKGVFKAVTKRYDVMMAVTSGIDSRSLLAASKDVQNRIYYFINQHAHLSEKSPDIRIPKEIFKKINVPFHIHRVEGVVDEYFRRIFFNNTFMSKDLLLPAIYNVYYKHHQEKVNLLGVGEIGREYYDKPPHDLDGYYLAWCLKYRKSKYAAKQCEKWLQETLNFADQYNIDIMKLFLWEVLLGNWGAVGNSESDIAIEEFDPYDSHYIYEVMLSLKKEQGDIFQGMFREMWPELLEFPFNPPETIKDKIKSGLTYIGIYMIMKQLKYRLDRWKFKKIV
jgi:hypothetical protein